MPKPDRPDTPTGSSDNRSTPSDPIAEALKADGVTVYAIGLCFMSVCATSDLSPEEVETKVRAVCPSGTSLNWHIHDENFAGGDPNGVECNSSAGRRHWLLSC